MTATLTDEALDRLAAAIGDDASRLAMLSNVARQGKRHQRAQTLAERARVLAPDDREIAAMTAFVLLHKVPRWHVSMIQDVERNAAYEAAIRRAVTPGMRVLDIGTGSGLLAMMAARSGAGRVATCETHAAIADAAREIVATNGLADTIAVRNVASHLYDPSEDLGGPADLVVSEILASDLLSEGVLPALQDAARRLLKPGGTMIPSAGEVRVALGQWTGPQPVIGDVCGFDLRAFNRLARPNLPVSVEDARLTLCSDAATLLSFGFGRRDAAMNGVADVTLRATADGANGFVQWIRIVLDDVVTYENRPDSTRTHGSHWYAAFYPLDMLRAAGDAVTIHGRYSAADLWLWSAAA